MIKLECSRYLLDCGLIDVAIRSCKSPPRRVGEVRLRYPHYAAAPPERVSDSAFMNVVRLTCCDKSALRGESMNLESFSYRLVGSVDFLAVLS